MPGPSGPSMKCVCVQVFGETVERAQALIQILSSLFISHPLCAACAGYSYRFCVISVNGYSGMQPQLW